MFVYICTLLSCIPHTHVLLISTIILSWKLTILIKSCLFLFIYFYFALFYLYMEVTRSLIVVLYLLISGNQCCCRCYYQIFDQKMVKYQTNSGCSLAISTIQPFQKFKPEILTIKFFIKFDLDRQK